MKRHIGQWREWVLAGGVMLFVLGVGFAAWQWVSSFHVTAGTTTGATVPSNQGGTGSQSSGGIGTPISNKIAPNFHLTNQFGVKGSLSQFRGKVVILSFIDSKCTTVCPLTAVVLQNVHYDLGNVASKVQFVAVNANPKATSVQDIYNWSKEHNVLHLWQYFTGTPTQLESVYRDYYVQSTVLQGTNIEHTPAIYVIGPNGNERWLYLNSDQSSTPVIGSEVRDVLKQVVPLIPGHPAVSIPPARQLAFLPGKLGPQGNQNRSFKLPAIFTNGTEGVVHVGDGGSPKLLEFFATWCPDCEEEMPTLAKFENWARSQSGLPSVVAVDLRLSEASTQHVKDYARKLKLPFPIALDNKDTVANMYRVNGIPTQVLVSSSGHILWYHQGLIGLKDLKAKVTHALASQNST